MLDPAKRKVEQVRARAFTLPTDDVESDGTLTWDSTTCVVVRVRHEDVVGTGYTYSHAVVAGLIESVLSPIVLQADVMNPPVCWTRMLRAVRNLGRQGLSAHAISAVDTALWDLKARLCGMSLTELWGRVWDRVPAYGSGGFTSYDELRLQNQLRAWREQGLYMGKIKVGRRPEQDIRRVQLARDALGSECALFVDANGAYTRKQAMYFADAFHEYDVSWFEEPVSSDDLQGLRLLRDRSPGPMAIAAGEYGYHAHDFRRLLEAGAVDVLQADVTRCLGFTGMFQAAALCEAHGIPLSAHCAPALSTHICVCLPQLQHIECFHDHVRLERELLDAAPDLVEGELVPDAHAVGHGMVLKPAAATKFALPDPGATHALGSDQDST